MLSAQISVCIDCSIIDQSPCQSSFFLAPSFAPLFQLLFFREIYIFIIFCIFKITLAQYDRRRSAFPFVSWFLGFCGPRFRVLGSGVWSSCSFKCQQAGEKMLSLLGVQNSGPGKHSQKMWKQTIVLTGRRRAKCVKRSSHLA